MGGRLLSLDEARAFLEGRPLFPGDDQWCAVGDNRNRDWVQVGSRHHHPGKSHNVDCGHYPPWGDDANNTTYGTPSWNYVVLYHKSGGDTKALAAGVTTEEVPVVMAVAVGTAVAAAEVVAPMVAPAAVPTKGEAPPLIEMVGVIKRELGLEGTLAEVVAEACKQLGVSTEGNTLAEQATLCWRSLVGC